MMAIYVSPHLHLKLGEVPHTGILSSFQGVQELLVMQGNYFFLLHAMTTQELSLVMLSQ
jgi:hypothetical protein